MFVNDVIPLTKIPIQSPQVLSYFFDKELKPGALVLVPLAGRKVGAIVKNCSPLKERKMEIKRGSFKLKKITKVICSEPVLSKEQINLVFDLHHYYLSSLGQITRLFLPKKLIRRKRFIKIPPLLSNSNQEKENPILLWKKRRFKFYLKEIRKTLDQEKQVLFLVPEIQSIKKVLSELKEIDKNPSLYHGQLKTSEQFKQWQKIRTNKAKIIIGTRSAVFSPCSNLGLIIIDQEQSPHYKSWQKHPKYNAKTIASKLSKMNKARLILGTDLPSINSYYLAQEGKYQLKKEKATYSLSSKIVDMREESEKEALVSDDLKRKLKENLNQGKKSILFINRRGAATSIFCRDCGYLVKCENCDAPLVYHKQNKKNYLLCHHCGLKTKPPTVCPNCEGHRIKYFGAGTQKVVDTLKEEFKAKIARLDSDIAPNFKKQKAIIDNFFKKGDILVGTELLLKISNFGKVNFLGFVLIDHLLNFPDFKAQERVFNMILNLNQAAKQILIQTYNPELSFFSFLEKPEQFLKKEIKSRKALAYPPFSQIVKLSFAHKNNNKAKRELEKLKREIANLSKNFDIQVLGPSPAFVPKVKNKYIWNLIIKCKSKPRDFKMNLKPLIPNQVKVDIDPLQIL